MNTWSSGRELGCDVVCSHRKRVIFRCLKAQTVPTPLCRNVLFSRFWRGPATYPRLIRWHEDSQVVRSRLRIRYVEYSGRCGWCWSEESGCEIISPPPGKIFASCEMTKCWANIWTKAQHFAGNQILSKIFTKIFPHKMTQKKMLLKDQDFGEDFATIKSGVTRV